MYYFYNGVCLPALPVVEGYKDAAIIRTKDGLYVLTYALPQDAYNTGAIVPTSSFPTYKYVDGEWVKFSPILQDYSGLVIWTNCDIYYKTAEEYGELSGKLFMAASDPVPVTTINPSALLETFFKGQAIRRSRGK